MKCGRRGHRANSTGSTRTGDGTSHSRERCQVRRSCAVLVRLWGTIVTMPVRHRSIILKPIAMIGWRPGGTDLLSRMISRNLLKRDALMMPTTPVGRAMFTTTATGARDRHSRIGISKVLKGLLLLLLLLLLMTSMVKGTTPSTRSGFRCMVTTYFRGGHHSPITRVSRLRSPKFPNYHLVRLS